MKLEKIEAALLEHNYKTILADCKRQLASLEGKPGYDEMALYIKLHEDTLKKLKVHNLKNYREDSFDLSVETAMLRFKKRK